VSWYSGNVEHVDFPGTARFEIKRRLGEGGMGVVYEAYDREKKAEVALKVLRRVVSGELARFKNEFRALQGIDHENLVALDELACHDDRWFFTMELVHGVDFLTYVGSQPRTGAATTLNIQSPAKTQSANGDAPPAELGPADQCIRVDEARLLSALGQLASALVAVHKSGKIHRDVKSSNVLVTPAGRLVLLDFGLTTSTDGSDSTLNQAIGTAEYMAPEQAVAETLSAAADWYAFGVLLYQTLTGVLPFSGTPVEILTNKQLYEPAPPRARSREVPGYLDRLCEDLLRIEPKARPGGDQILERLGVATLATTRRSASSPSQFTQTMAFVGREDELERLRAGFEQSRDQPVVTIVEGSSGLGKSALVMQFTEALQRERPGVVVLAGRCYERESVPYKAFDGIADALARYLLGIPKADAIALLPRRAALLPRLFPVLQRVEVLSQAPMGEDTPDPEELRLRMFDALRELLERLAARHPLVLVIDDLQWTDADSLTLLQELMAHADAPRALLVATRRPVVDPRKRAALAVVDELAQGKLIEVGALPLERARELAELLLPGSERPRIEAIIQEAAGHPLFLQELARHSAAHGASLDEVLFARIEQLAPAPRHLLEILCTAGNPIAQEVAARAAELGYSDHVRAARVLRVGYLVRTDGMGEADLITAYHDRIREVVMHHLDDGRARQHHERLAITLKSLGAASSNPHALVRHAEAAGDPKRAATYAELAAAHAVGVGAFDRASQFLQTALELGGYDADKTRQLQLQLADALGNAGRRPQAAELYLAIAEGAEPMLQTDCRRRAADHWIKSGHTERGLEVMELLLEQFGASMPATPTRALASLVWHRARLRLGGLRWTEKSASDIPARELARIDLFQALGQGLSMVDSIRAMDFQTRALRLALRAGEPLRIAQGLLLESGHVATGGVRAQNRARAVAQRAADLGPDDNYVGAWRSASEGFIDYFCGRLRPAAARFDEIAGTAMSDVPGATWERDSARLFHMWSLSRMGRLAEMAPLLADCVRRADRRGDLYTLTSLIRSCHIGWLARDEPARARRVLEQVSWAPTQGQYHLQHWFAFRARAEMELYDAATDWSRGNEDFAELKASLLMRVAVLRLDAHWLRGRMALASIASASSPTRFLKIAKRMARKLERERDPYATPSAQLLRAAIAAQHDLAEQAIELLNSAAASADEADLLLHSASAHRRRGELLGGEEGAAIIAEADAQMAAQGVVNPARMTNVFAPGFPA